MHHDYPLSEMRRRLAMFVLIILLMAVTGSIGFVLLEGWSFAESLYMTVITLSTVGFAEVHPLHPGGRAFTTALIVAGIATVAYLFSAVSQYVVSGELRGTIRSRRMRQRIEALSGHYVVCGFGRVGREVVADLREKGHNCVVVEKHSDDHENENEDILWVNGDAADDESLRSAGIERARGLVVATGDDPTNLFVTVSAHALNPDLCIVARMNDQSSGPKLLRAGATHVISPYTISGRRIAAQLVSPALTDFLDVVMHSGDLELWLEECRVSEESELQGKTVGEANVRQATGANVLAVRRGEGGAILTNPAPDMRFAAGDVLIALGTREQLKVLNRTAGFDA